VTVGRLGKDLPFCEQFVNNDFHYFKTPVIDRAKLTANDEHVNDIIYPRSPREKMAGWMYLPRFLDKIRLSQAGKLHADYQPNYLHKGFDAKWLESAGLEAEEFVAVVNNTFTDGQVADWVRENVEVDEATRDLFNDAVGNYGADESNTELRERLAQRKAEAGMADRDDVRCFVDFIDADEGRL